MMPGPEQVNGPQKRKRSPRAAVACEACRESKSKCDQGNPCRVCAKSSRECVYREKRSSKTGPTKPLPKGPALTFDSQTAVNVERARLQQTPMTKSGAVPNRQLKPLVPRPLLPSIEGSGSLSGHLEQYDGSEHHGSSIGNDQNWGEDSDGRDKNPSKQPRSKHVSGEVGRQSTGTEFYGPTATLVFLLELRSRARSFQSQLSQEEMPSSLAISESKDRQELSNINVFRDSEDLLNPTEEQSLPNYERTSTANVIHHSPLAPVLSVSSPASSISSYAAPNIEVEKECIQLYFANLHLIYYFLNKDSFLVSCERLVWSPVPLPSRHQTSSKFLALYNAVVAVGALTAGDDTAFAQSREKVQGFLEGRIKQLNERYSSTKSIYPPLELAQIYFAKAKSLLGDLFEVCSLEYTQTLLLMSIFCQYALRPHATYMYSGMTSRMAAAIGMANEPDLTKTSIDAIRTWWVLYYHEMEVCCSLGRESFLRAPSYYSVYMANFPDPLPPHFAVLSDEKVVFFARAMTELAYILKRTSEEIYHSSTAISQIDQARIALSLDEDLLKWKRQVSSMYDFENTGLTEPETITKRRIVLKLRFYSTRILIHRPFLVAAAHQGNHSLFTVNIKHCLDASRETIHLLYDTFMNRPFFRTWWYNTTYAFHSITVILYVLVSRLQERNSDELLKVVEMSLKIFQAMDGIAVARRCAELTQEIFDIAKLSVQAQQQRSQPTTNAAAASQAPVSDAFGSGTELVGGTALSWGDIDSSYALQDDFFSSLADPSILDAFGTNFKLNNLGWDISTFDGIDLMQEFGH